MSMVQDKIDFEKKRIGITGATGTLGKRLVCKLIEQGHRVIALCRNKKNAEIQFDSHVEIIEGDITQPDSLKLFVNKLDVCLHIAAQVDHASKEQYWNVNVNGTKNLCENILNNNPKCRFIYCSSIAVLRFKAMKTNYSLSKASGENIVRSMMCKGLTGTIIYPGLIYGPGDERFVPYLLKGLKKGSIPLVGGGESWAPVIYIDDLCELFIKTAESNYAVGKSFLGIQQTAAGMHDFIKCCARQGGYPVPQKKVLKSQLLMVALLLKWMYSITGNKKKPPIDKRIVDILSINYRAPTFENEHCLGWYPATSFEDGIKRFINETRLN